MLRAALALDAGLLDGGNDTGWGSRDHDLRGDGEEPEDGASSQLGKHIAYECVGRVAVVVLLCVGMWKGTPRMSERVLESCTW